MLMVSTLYQYTKPSRHLGSRGKKKKKSHFRREPSGGKDQIVNLRFSNIKRKSRFWYGVNQQKVIKLTQKKKQLG